VLSVGHLRWSGLQTRSDLEIDVNRHVLHGDVVPHDHDFVEVAVVLGGAARHETLYDGRRVERGDAFVIRPGAWHAFRACDDLTVVNCCFRAHLLERELLWLAEEPRLRFLLWPGGGVGDGVVRVRLPPAGLKRCGETLGELADPPGEEPRAHQLAHLLLLLCGLVRHLDAGQLAGAERLASAPAGVAEALRLLASDLARPWTVRDLADAVAVSPAHLSRLFRGTVGRPPMAHLGVLRAEAAAVRLLRTAEPVSGVGAAVGWSDPNYFARRFRAHFGTSPTAFRRSVSGRAPERPVSPPSRRALERIPSEH
jgi:AraC family transcriptional regulator, L-rhamnose operon transcriptional activator RhaR